MAKRGRRSQFETKGPKLLEAFKEGVASVAVARQIAGVSYRQWIHWKRKGMSGDEGYEQWWTDVQRARGNVSALCEQTIYKAIEQGSTADAKWYLKTHGPAVYRGESEDTEESSQVMCYVPTGGDEAVERLQQIVQRVLAVCDDLPKEERELVLKAING